MKEVDFVLEALNAERAATLFADQHEQLKIPTVRWDLTAPRILTMEFCEVREKLLFRYFFFFSTVGFINKQGVKINDVEAIKKQGLNPVDVANIVVSVFSDMIFTFGWLHADPHPGNLLVRKNEHGKPQVVLLDHGLYRDLGETVRVEHCKFWKAMVLFFVIVIVFNGCLPDCYGWRRDGKVGRGPGRGQVCVDLPCHV